MYDSKEADALAASFGAMSDVHWIFGVCVVLFFIVYRWLCIWFTKNNVLTRDLYDHKSDNCVVWIPSDTNQYNFAFGEVTLASYF